MRNYSGILGMPPVEVFTKGAMRVLIFEGGNQASDIPTLKKSVNNENKLKPHPGEFIFGHLSGKELTTCIKELEHLLLFLKEKEKVDSSTKSEEHIPLPKGIKIYQVGPEYKTCHDTDDGLGIGITGYQILHVESATYAIDIIYNNGAWLPVECKIILCKKEDLDSGDTVFVRYPSAGGSHICGKIVYNGDGEMQIVFSEEDVISRVSVPEGKCELYKVVPL